MNQILQLPEFRLEKPTDFTAIHQVNQLAFARENEANLVDILRKNVPVFSFVAVEKEQVIGHILYSSVSLESGDTNNLNILGLAPLAVLPSHQNKGIGSFLIEYSLRECASRGCDAVVVLGHHNFYNRFGFITAKTKNLSCDYPVPDEVFMVLELRDNCLTGMPGIVKYSPEFDNV
jgi:putative acetyltransferase